METANSAGADLGGLSASPNSLLDPSVPQQIHNVAEDTKMMSATIDQIKAKKGITDEQARALKLIGTATFLGSFSNAASQSKRPSMQVEQNAPAQVIRSGGFEAPASPEEPVRWGAVGPSPSASILGDSRAEKAHPEIVDISEATHSAPPTVLVLQSPPTTDSFDDKLSLQFNESAANGAYRSDFSKSKIASEVAATTTSSQPVGNRPSANALEEAVSKILDSGKFKELADKNKTNKKPGLASKNAPKRIAQNSGSYPSTESPKSFLSEALGKATKAGFSVLKSTGLLFDLGEKPSREIASFDAMATDTSSDVAADDDKGYFELFILLAGALAVAAGYYTFKRNKKQT